MRMDVWKQIAAGGLVGTDRQPFGLPEVPGALGTALAGIPHESSPRALLASAAVVGAYERAGRPLESVSAKPPPAPADELRPPSVGLTRILKEILAGDSNLPTRELLAEYFTTASQRGLAIPHSLLPQVLDVGAGDRELREMILPALDARGRWLSAQKPEWKFALGGGDESKVWDEGQPAARAAYLWEVRKAEPSRARELLESGWKKESASDRKAFLSIFESRLSMDDETFLEAALEDRGKDVRRIAADLLSRLPESEFAKRAVARAAEVMRIESKLLRKKLVVTPPEALDEAAKRDGLASDDPGLSELGEKARWLYAMIAVTPLAHWESELGESPETLIQLASKTDWELAVLAGWFSAAKRQKNKAWILALVRDTKSKASQFDMQDLLAALGREELEADAIRLVGESANWEFIFYRISLIKGSWSEALTRAVARPLRGAMKGKSGYYLTEEGMLLLGTHGHPDFYPEAYQWGQKMLETQPPWERAIHKFLATYLFRHTMHREMQS